MKSGESELRIDVEMPHEFLDQKHSPPPDIHPDLQVFYNRGYVEAQRDMTQYFLGHAEAALARVKWQINDVLSRGLGRDVQDVTALPEDEAAPCAICGEVASLFLVTFDNGEQTKICREHEGR